MYTGMKRVQLGTRHDGEIGRDIDQVRGTSMFGIEGRSGAVESERAEKRAYGVANARVLEVPPDVEQRPLFNVADLKATFSERLAGDGWRLGEQAFAFEGRSVDECVRYVEMFSDGQPTGGWLGNWVVAGIAGMVGRALSLAPDVDEYVEALALLAGSKLGRWAEPSDIIRSRLTAIEPGSLRRVAATWLARTRAGWLQDRSDADLPRLRAFEAAVEENVDLDVARRWGELVRWNVGRDPTARPGGPIGAQRCDGAGWDVGLVRCHKLLLDEIEAGRRAVDRLRVLHREGMGSEPAVGLEVIGLVALFDATHAATLLQRRLSGVHVTPEMAVKGARRPAEVLGKFGEQRLGEIARRRGWLIGDIEEPTRIERAMRGVRGGGVDGAPVVRITDEALDDFAETGDSRGIVDAMAAVPVIEAPTRFTLKVKELDDLADQVTRLGRLAYEALVGPLVVRRDFAEALFWRFPRHVIAEGTELAHGNQGATLRSVV
jgi:hypothetical protein